MNLKTKSTTFEVEAGWRLVMVPLAETPLFSRDSHDSRKLGSGVGAEQSRAPGVSRLGSWDLTQAFWSLC